MPASSRFLRFSSPTFGNVAGDFLRPELGVARHRLEFLDMDRGEDVVAHDALGDQDRVLEVVAVPGHEGDERILAQRQLAQLRRRTVGDDVALLHQIAHLHQRTLVDAGRRRWSAGTCAGDRCRCPAWWDRFLRSRARRYGWRPPDRPRRSGARRWRRRNPGPPLLPCRCRPAAPPGAAAARPGAACSSPSGRGWRRHSPGTAPAPRPPTPAAWAKRR